MKTSAFIKSSRQIIAFKLWARNYFPLFRGNMEDKVSYQDGNKELMFSFLLLHKQNCYSLAKDPCTSKRLFDAYMEPFPCIYLIAVFSFDL